MLPFESVTEVYRVGRASDPLALPPWYYAPFGGRFDDPEGSYRCLYVAVARYGAFLESLQRYRPDLDLLCKLEEIAAGAPMAITTAVPDHFFVEYRIARAALAVPGDNGIVDLVSARGMGAAYAVLRAATRRSGIRMDDYTAASLLSKEPRAFTNAVSRLVYEAGYAGLAYRSCYDPDAVCVALFEERHSVDAPQVAEVVKSDLDFRAACQVHHLEVTIAPGSVSSSGSAVGKPV